MSRQVRLRIEAMADLESISNYLRERNPAAAERFIRATAKDLRRLAEMPGLGGRRRVRNRKLGGLRSWPVSGFGRYLAFYLPETDGIDVVGIFHGARDIDRILNEER